MGAALEVLTDGRVLGDLKLSTDALVRVLGALEWSTLFPDPEQANAGGEEGEAGQDPLEREPLLHLYEHFLSIYDPELRKKSGSYYTPTQVVTAMVAMTDDALVRHLGLERGLVDEKVTVVDPAMGTGTFPLAVIDRVAARAAKIEGKGMVPEVVSNLATRLVGFEMQAGPFSVAELRVAAELKRRGASAPDAGLRLHVTDTLASPWSREMSLPLPPLDKIAASRAKANVVKVEQRVMVVIGNPPYKDKAKGLGGWIENGIEEHPVYHRSPPMADFKAEGNGRYEYVLSNLYAFFWRWAMWKVFDPTVVRDEGPDALAHKGVVSFVTSAGFLKGPGFAGMRARLRATCDEVYVLDLGGDARSASDGDENVFDIMTPVAVTIAVRNADGPRAAGHQARVRYASMRGTRKAKLAALAVVTSGLDDVEWTEVAGAGGDVLAVVEQDWLAVPALGDLMPWVAPGVKPNRTWVYAPEVATLELRWDALVAAPDHEEEGGRSKLFKETDSSALGLVKPPLGDRARRPSFRAEPGPLEAPVRVGYRSFDRQWVIPDGRVHHRPSPDLWTADGPQQVHAVEPHSFAITAGPALVFSAHVPDMHHYKGNSGGRALPMWRDAEATTPNLVPGLRAALSGALGTSVDEPADVLAYAAALCSHPGYTTGFRQAYAQAPGVRVPLTRDAGLWARAVTLGREVIWLHTYGERMADADAERPATLPTLAQDRRPLVEVGIAGTAGAMPEKITYDEATQTLCVGAGRISPVSREVWDYEVSGMKVVSKWFGYRKKAPAGKRSSALDDIVATTWTTTMTRELLALLSVLQRVVDLHEAQDALLAEVLAGETLSVADLTEAGALPVSKEARRAPVRQRFDACDDLGLVLQDDSEWPTRPSA